MSISNPIALLSSDARALVLHEASMSRMIDDSFVSTFTPFSRQEEGSRIGMGKTDAPTKEMRLEISQALDRLDTVIEKVLKDREQAEAAAATWIFGVGIVVVLLVLAAAFAPVFSEGRVLPSIFSSLSVVGLLYLLYFPVQRRLSIANDRTNLMLTGTTFRLRFATARTEEQVRELGRELTSALRVSN